MKTYVVIDIGGTNIKYGLMAEEEYLLEEHEVATQAHKGAAFVVETVKGIVEQYLDRKPSGVCISTAGIVDSDKGEIVYAGPHIANYTGTQFKKIVEEEFAIPCEVENDVNCAGLAEALSGSGMNSKAIVCLTIGTGIGGCLILEKQVFHGFSNAACEVGYIRLPEGDFQDLASTKAMVEYVAELHGDDVADWSGRRIFTEAEKGNSLCVQGIDRMVDYLGQGIANICYVVNPELVILGGGIMAQEAILKPKLQAALETYLLPSLAEKTKLVFAKHKNTAGMFGAYYHFKNQEAKRR